MTVVRKAIDYGSDGMSRLLRGLIRGPVEQSPQKLLEKCVLCTSPLGEGGREEKNWDVTEGRLVRNVRKARKDVIWGLRILAR